MTKLFDIPNNTWVRIISQEVPPPGGMAVDVGQEVFFHHVDGMYSFCSDRECNTVHLKAWTEVEIV